MKNLILIILLILNVIFINYLANYIYKVEIIENKVELKKYINQILVKIMKIPKVIEPGINEEKL